MKSLDLRAALVSLLLLTALVGAEFGLLVGAGLWLKLLLPATLLLIGHLVIALNRGFMVPLVVPEAVADSAGHQGPPGFHRSPARGTLKPFPPLRARDRADP